MMKLVVMPYVNFKWEFGESFLGKIQEIAFVLLYSPVSLPYLGIANPSKI